MRRIAIVSAMHQELAALLRLMPDEAPLRRAGREFWIGHLDGHEVVAVLSGVGKVAAATTATLLAGELGVERAIFTGTAGGVHQRARVGDVVVAETLLQHDMDASPLFPRHEIPFYGTDRFATDAAMSAGLAAAARAVLGGATQRRDGGEGNGDGDEGLDATLLASFGIATPAVHSGLVLSGDRFVASAGESEELRRRLPDALAVEMEGAALAQVAFDFGLPFAVVRTVSDRADDSAHVDFMRFVDAVASRYTVAIVRRYLRDLAP
ncbi:MAG: 5'-methylthioadenosine/adenosylhomocysteine nucleosidase [Burkholderiales bacterium]|nr:5'-methylthioadenosine/adenosylhomocysteine nucleosidase [Burkholderiales bacterium]